jgi:hypothetical protein
MKGIINDTERFLGTGLTAYSGAELDRWAEEFGRSWFQKLGLLAPLVKHPKFAEEAEWRVVYPLKREDMRRLQFRQRQGLMARHIPLHFGDRDQHDYSPLPIRSIMVGPARHKEVSRVSVNALLQSFGYSLDGMWPISVAVSDVPFRTT